MRHSAVQSRTSSVATMQRRNSISLRDLISMVYPATTTMPADVATAALTGPTWQVVLRTATNAPIANNDPRTATQVPVRKYLWVRRTSRRAYNRHMSKMRETISDVNPMPAILIFTSIVGIAFGLSILMH